ncbi:MAG: hypothetical protein BWX70_01549 [Verrucomicrobia bacterium ADurb.Bin070]|nr:MAG: hypothetical protein BWX70_01549 [Verrucomicrobia bacterium ADurb.Bin070]
MTTGIRKPQSAVALVLTSLFLVGIAAQAASPDWRARYSELKTQAAADFQGAQIGDRVTIVLSIGGDRTGTLAALSDDKVVLSIAGRHQTFERRKLTPASRQKLFPEDYAHFVAMEQVEKERKEWDAEQAQARQEQAERAAEQARQRAAEQRAAEQARLEGERAAAKKRLEEAHLVLMDWRWSEEYGYVTVEGQVGNISGRKLENVEAVARFFAEDGSFITSDSSIIEYNPLMPGQVSPFKVMDTHNPMMKKASVAFKLMWGPALTTINKEEYEKATKGTD